MNQTKLNELKKWMKKQNVDWTYISDPKHIAYFSGYESEPHERVLALFISLTEDDFLFTPALEVEDAQNSLWSSTVYGYLDSEKPFEKITQLLKKQGHPTRIAIEKEALSVARFEALASHFPTTDFSVSVTPLIERLQLIKTSEEIERLLEAGKWADVALEIGFQTVKEGVSEQEILAEIEYQLKKQGIQQMSFDTLVLSGKNAASPHGTPSQKKIHSNEFVLFDLGVVKNGYCSDVTRTFSYKEPDSFQAEIYSIVLEAQLAAMDAVKPGVTTGYLDRIAREIITSHGYGEYFNHRLGHGIGTTVHEYPSLISGNELVLEKGMCFSIEPGIYIPEKIGVRIEDCVYVTENGCVPFTNTSKELTIID